MRRTVLVLMGLLAPAGCGDGSQGGVDAGSCTPTAICRPDEVESADACADCRTTDDGCGGDLYCAPDPTCQTPCPEGEFQEFGDCDNPTACTTRTACDEPIVCRDQTICLAEELCPDGGFLLEACPAGAQNCLPYIACGVTRYCPTLSGCARTACQLGEAPTTLSCGDPSIVLPCRESDACAPEIVSCVCGSAQLLCDRGETVDTSPCVAGQVCRAIVACGITLYCKGASI